MQSIGNAAQDVAPKVATAVSSALSFFSLKKKDLEKGMSFPEKLIAENCNEKLREG